MDAPRALIAVTTAVIVVTTVISGPLVGAVDFTTASASNPLRAETTDRATVEIATDPSGPVVLDQGEFGNDAYRLDVPSVTVRIIEVRGRPRLTYKVRIPGLRYSRVTSYFLNASMTGGQRLQLMVAKDTIQPDRVNESEYRAELAVTVHDSSGSRVIYRTNTTVVVRE